MTQTKPRRIHLSAAEHRLLLEALRRRLCFNNLRQGICEQWTGLGPRSLYAPAVKRGLMEILNHGYATRVSCWWRLTPLGAAVVEAWMRFGYTRGGYGTPRNEMGEVPPQDVTIRAE